MDADEIHLPLWIKDQPRDDALEPVHARQLSEDTFEILSSPGFALDVAAGDVVRMLSDRPGNFEVIRRGGNLAVQILNKSPIGPIREELTPLIEALGGWLDGAIERGLVYTIPVTAGFDRIEAAIEGVLKNHPDATWIFGNVYRPDDGVTPLNWW